MQETDKPGALGSNAGLGPLVEAAGMVNFLDHGAASHVSSEGCHGVTQEHLEQFAALLVAAERERCAREPVAAQCRFPGVAWSQCDVEHARMVMANPSEWPTYQVRLLCEWVGPNVLVTGLSPGE